jgi:predicted nucleotidyltransferase
MGNIFHKLFEDFIKALNKNEVEYMVVGGYSVILYGYSRTTGDLDIWVNKTPSNYKKLVAAFNEFGLPVFDMTEENFLSNPAFDVFSFGRAPVSVDILTHVKGLEFHESFEHAKFLNVEGIEVRLIDFRDLILAKKAAGRHKDLDDLENLEKEL